MCIQGAPVQLLWYLLASLLHTRSNQQDSNHWKYLQTKPLVENHCLDIVEWRQVTFTILPMFQVQRDSENKDEDRVSCGAQAALEHMGSSNPPASGSWEAETEAIPNHIQLIASAIKPGADLLQSSKCHVLLPCVPETLSHFWYLLMLPGEKTGSFSQFS